MSDPGKTSKRCGPGDKKKPGRTDRGHSRSFRAGAIEESKGNRASYLGPHLPGAVEGLDPIKEALKILWLGLVSCGNTHSLSQSTLSHWLGHQDTHREEVLEGSRAWLGTTARLYSEPARCESPA